MDHQVSCLLEDKSPVACGHCPVSLLVAHDGDPGIVHATHGGTACLGPALEVIAALVAGGGGLEAVAVTDAA